MTLALSITDLHKSFNENNVIKGMSLQANKGDVISLISASGSGQSTFLRCIYLAITLASMMAQKRAETWANKGVMR